MSHVQTVLELQSAPLRWLVPLAVGLTGVGYQIAVGESQSPIPGTYLKFAADIVVFGLISPILVFYGWSALWRARQEKVEAERRAGRLLTALDAVTPDVVVVLDNRGCIECWNDRAEALFGYARQEVAGRPFVETLVGKPAIEADWRRFLQLVRRQGAAERFELILRKRDGGELMVEVSGRELQDSGGRSGGLLLIVHDATLRTHPSGFIDRNSCPCAKVVEQARLTDDHKRAGRAQAEVLSFVAHEVRLSLANILGGTERLQAACVDPTPSFRQNTKLIRDQISLLDGLVREVLDAARTESGGWTLYREPTPTAAIVRQTLEQFRIRCDDRLINVRLAEDEMTVVDADRERIVCVLRNLLSNAAKYSPPGTAIDLDSVMSAEFVTLRVRDRGPGLPEDCLRCVFGKFYRVRYADSAGIEGHGLGLYICSQIVSAHGGQIWAQNHPDGGAVFSFTLPIAQ